MRKMGEKRATVIENKGVRRSRTGRFCEVLEVAVNKGLCGILEWAKWLSDAMRLTEGVALTTNQ